MLLFVRTLELEIRIIMIELPDQPGIRIVATIALLTKGSLMSVILLVTVITGLTCILECRGWVAGFAPHHGMLTNQREFTEVVIVAHILQPPGSFVMTVVAKLAFLLLVRVLVLVTAVTIGIEFHILGTHLVTGLATGLLVSTTQWKLGFLAMVEFGL